MPFPRRLSGRLIAILSLIALSVFAIVSIGEGFKAVLVRRDVDKLERRDGSSTVTLGVPWEPVHVPTRPEIKGFKDVSQDAENSLIGDIAAVALAILGGGSEVASAASAGAAELQATPLSASASVLGDGTASQSSLLREVNGQIQQATNIVGQIIGDATSIIGSILTAATAPSNIGVLPVANSNSSMNGTAFSSGNLMPSNSSHPTFPPNTTIFASPCPSPAIAPAMVELTQPPTTPPCPTTITEICTVTETWHSTHYAETATFYSFVANTTITYTEKYSSPPLFYLPGPTTTVPPQRGLIACANGALAKRQEDCPYKLNATSSHSPNASGSASDQGSSPTSTHPCPNAGYSCAECPDGWFCPPHPTPAQNCICGFGWACANCKDGYFCIPSPTPAGNGLMNTVASLLATPPPSSTLSNMGSITTKPPTLMSLGSMVSMPTGTVTCIDGSIVMMANECLNGLRTTSNTVDITIINMPMAADAAAAASINDLAGRVFSTAKAVSSPLLSNAQPPAACLGNIAPIATSNVATQLFPPINDQTTALPVFQNGNPTVLSAVSKLMMNGVPTNSPVLNFHVGQLPSALGSAQPAAGLGNIAEIALPTANPNLLPTTTATQGNVQNNIPKHASNAAENVFNQLMSGATTNSAMLMAPAGQLPPLPPALGIARGRRRV
ncbi:hypothetical protein BGZ57DRAFT_37939 [Hyaloscypha finlandica]|nr:hypothetical protein BGZ57DRAFT_37939 [Hyaloscypha finlandica]